MNQKIGSRACLLVVVAWMLTGCASIFKGTSSKVNLSSEPSKAKVYVNGVGMGETPIRLKLKSNEVYNLEFKAAGYETEKFTITNGVGVGWIILDVLGGFIPIIVDAATGSWYNLDQKNINAILEKQ